MAKITHHMSCEEVISKANLLCPFCLARIIRQVPLFPKKICRKRAFRGILDSNIVRQVSSEVHPFLIAAWDLNSTRCETAWRGRMDIGEIYRLVNFVGRNSSDPWFSHKLVQLSTSPTEKYITYQLMLGVTQKSTEIG